MFYNTVIILRFIQEKGSPNVDKQIAIFELVSTKFYAR